MGDGRCHSPSPSVGLAGQLAPDLDLSRPPQATAGGQQANRLEEIRLARAVRADKEHRAALERDLSARVGAEVREDQMG